MTGLWVGPEDHPNRIRLGPAVASGAEGVIYRGFIDLASGPLQVAVKMLHPGHAAQLGEWSARWLDQAELLRSAEIPGLVPVRESFVGPLPHSESAADSSTGSVYLVMDWVDGVTLDRWARTAEVPDAEQLLLVLVSVGAALDRLHAGIGPDQVAVVHRDVKPSNIIVQPDGSTVLVDVGSVRGLLDGSRRSGIVGTPGYIAPEVRADGRYSPASDRYSLGAVAFSLLTGVEPPANGDLDTMRAVLETAPLVTGRPDLIAHVLQMLNPDPAQRPAHLANWVAQLRRSSLAIAPGEVALPPRAPIHHGTTQADKSRRPSRRRRALALTSTVITLAAAAGAWWAVRPTSPPAENRTPTSAAGAASPSTVPPAVTGVDWENFDYPADTCGLPSVQLRNGEFVVRDASGEPDFDGYLTPSVTFWGMTSGELDDEPGPEVVVEVSCEAGTAGYLEIQVWTSSSAGEPLLLTRSIGGACPTSPSPVLCESGDWATLIDVERPIKDGLVGARQYHGEASDSRCCPSTHVDVTMALIDGELHVTAAKLVAPEADGNTYYSWPAHSFVRGALLGWDVSVVATEEQAAAIRSASLPTPSSLEWSDAVHLDGDRYQIEISGASGPFASQAAQVTYTTDPARIVDVQLLRRQ